MSLYSILYPFPSILHCTCMPLFLQYTIPLSSILCPFPVYYAHLYYVSFSAAPPVYYVPVFRAVDNFTPPRLTPPCTMATCHTQERELSKEMGVAVIGHAFAGPMPPSQVYTLYMYVYILHVHVHVQAFLVGYLSAIKVKCIEFSNWK